MTRKRQQDAWVPKSDEGCVAGCLTDEQVRSISWIGKSSGITHASATLGTVHFPIESSRRDLEILQSREIFQAKITAQLTQRVNHGLSKPLGEITQKISKVSVHSSAPALEVSVL